MPVPAYRIEQAGQIPSKLTIRLLEEIVASLSVIDSVNWTDAMIHSMNFIHSTSYRQ